MPNQNSPAQDQSSQNPVPTTGNSDGPQNPLPFSPQSDLPPLPPDFQKTDSGAVAPTEDVVNASPASSNGSGAPSDLPPVISGPKKKFGSGRIIATILGLFLLIGGVGTGVYLTQQNQNIQEKARGTECSNNADCGSGMKCSAGICVESTGGGGAGTGVICTAPKVNCDGSCVNRSTDSSNCGGCGNSCGANRHCAGGKCVDNPDGGGGTQQCSSGSTQCSGNVVQVCTGGNWVNGTTCSNGCSNGTCNAAATLPNCSTVGSNLSCQSGGTLSGSTACNSNGQSALCCPQGQHIANGACASGVANACGTGLSCGQFAVSGTSPCTQSSTGTATNCCPAGQTYSTNGCTGGAAGATVAGQCGIGPDQCIFDNDVGSAFCGGEGNKYSCKNTKSEIGAWVVSGAANCTCPADHPIKSGTSTQVCLTPTNCSWTGGYNGTSIHCSTQQDTGCGGTSGGGPTAQCQNIKAYDSNWAALSSAQLSALQPGANINFCVVGSATEGSFDKAQFTINGAQGAETTTHRPSTQDFCQAYVIPTGVTIFNVTAQIHHLTLGWK